MTRVEEIRRAEAMAHDEMYKCGENVYAWLKKPVKVVADLLTEFDGYEQLRVLDLGCGIGRNIWLILQRFKDIDCQIDAVDSLESAIKGLMERAKELGVGGYVKPILGFVDEYVIGENSYDLILAISILEHVANKEIFTQKLFELRDGMRRGGIVCLVMNSDVEEVDLETGKNLEPQFEVKLWGSEVVSECENIFAGWEVLQRNISAQRYITPRKGGKVGLRTKVVTFVARKVDMNAKAINFGQGLRSDRSA